MPNQTGQKLRKYNIKYRFSKAKATIPKQKQNSKVGKTSWKARKSNYKTVYQKNWKAEVAFKTMFRKQKIPLKRWVSYPNAEGWKYEEFFFLKLWIKVPNLTKSLWRVIYYLSVPYK